MWTRTNVQDQWHEGDALLVDEQCAFLFLKAFKENKVKLRSGQPWIRSVLTGEDTVSRQMLEVFDEGAVGSSSVRKAISALSKLQQTQEIFLQLPAKRSVGNAPIIQDLTKQTKVQHNRESRK